MRGKFFECVLKYDQVCEKNWILGKIFWYVRKNFGMFAKITAYYGKCFGMSGKNFLVTFPPPPKILGRNIN